MVRNSTDFKCLSKKSILIFNIMKKSILNLEGAQELSKNQQKEVIGGKAQAPNCSIAEDCYGYNPNSCAENGSQVICHYGRCTLAVC